MLVQASATGFIRTVIIIIGVFVILRFFGKLMIAKRAMQDERELNARNNNLHKERKEKLNKFGKVSVLSKLKSSKTNYTSVEDVPFEEIED